MTMLLMLNHFQSKIYYYCREKHYRHVQKVAQEGLQKYGNDPVLKFFNAFSMIVEGKASLWILYYKAGP